MSANTNYDWRMEPGGTKFTSLLLLLIFVAAAAIMASIVLFRPGLGSDNPPAVAEPGAQPAVLAPAPVGSAPPLLTP